MKNRRCGTVYENCSLLSGVELEGTPCSVSATHTNVSTDLIVNENPCRYARQGFCYRVGICATEGYGILRQSR